MNNYEKFSFKAKVTTDNDQFKYRVTMALDKKEISESGICKINGKLLIPILLSL